MSEDSEMTASVVINCAMRIHKRLGPGLLEWAYESILVELLRRQGFDVQRQQAISIDFEGICVADAFRADFIVNGCLVVEVKSIERLSPVHLKQVLTYLRLLDLPLGLLINFNQETLRDGLRRVVNGPSSFVPSRLRANVQNPKKVLG